MFRCDFCSTTFSSLSNLNSHKKTAKYCLKLQNENTEQSLQCEYCKKIFNQDKTLSKHLQICKSRKQQITNEDIAKLKIENQNLQDKILSYETEIIKLKEENIKLKENLAREEGKTEIFNRVKCKSVKNITTTVNQYVNPKLKFVPIENIQPLTIETIQLKIPNYTYDQFLRAELGLIEHFLTITLYEDENNIINKNYVCSNVSLNTFHALVQDKVWKKDNGATYIHKYLDLLKVQVDEHFSKLDEELFTALENDDHFRIECMKQLHKDLSPFRSAIKSKPGTKSREELLISVRSGIKNRLSI